MRAQNDLKEYCNRLFKNSRKRVVPFARVCDELGRRHLDRVSRDEYLGICERFDDFHVGVEPDPRYTEAIPRLGEQVVLFRLAEKPRKKLSDGFTVAAAVLGVAAGVAQADEEVVVEEETALERYLEEKFDIRGDEQMRLGAWLEWLLLSRPRKHAGLLVAKERLARLSEAERKEVTRFVLTVAASDRVINRSEIEYLERLFAGLGLEEELPRELSRVDGAYVVPQTKSDIEEPRRVITSASARSKDQAGALLGVLFGEDTKSLGK
jgi:uncharacterized tellurite resistance protein B-like protein